MPHGPFSFENRLIVDIKEFNAYNFTKAYLEYYKFFMKKFENLIENIDLENKRVIIVGDHGHRSAGEFLNPNKTNLYTYGFKGLDLSKIESVQDIGFLINQSF